MYCDGTCTCTTIPAQAKGAHLEGDHSYPGITCLFPTQGRCIRSEYCPGSCRAPRQGRSIFEAQSEIAREGDGSRDRKRLRGRSAASPTPSPARTPAASRQSCSPQARRRHSAGMHCPCLDCSFCRDHNKPLQQDDYSAWWSPHTEGGKLLSITSGSMGCLQRVGRNPGSIPHSMCASSGSAAD